MTTDEITALRKEFEDAIFTACNDFKTKTGVSVIGINIDKVTHMMLDMSRPIYHMTGVHVVLEIL